MLLQEGDVLVVGDNPPSFLSWSAAVELTRIERAAVEPPVAIGMAVAESKAGAAAVPAGGQIRNGELTQLVIRICREPAIAEGRLAFINEGEEPRGSNSGEITGFVEDLEGAVHLEGVGIGAHPTVERETADARRWAERCREGVG